MLSKTLGKDVSPFLENPKFKNSFRTINSEKRITIINFLTYKKAIQVEFPYDEKIIERIKKEKVSLPYGTWDKEKKAWIFALHESSLISLKNLAQDFNFSTDDEFDLYVSQLNNINQNLENYVPMLSMDNGKFVLKNVSDFVPKFESDHLIEAVAEARKRGISVWDDDVVTAFEQENIPKWIKNFFKSSPDNSCTVAIEKSNLDEFNIFLKYMSPCLFVIPGGSEIEKLKIAHELLTKNGILPEEISVMFRLPSETGKNFNIFVKENMINNPISEKTKAVFISTKIPKPLIQSNIKFHSVFNLGVIGVHYSIRDFVTKHENLIFLTETLK